MHIFAQWHPSELEWPQTHCPYCGHLVIKTKSHFIPQSPLYSPVSNFQLILIPLLCVLFFLIISRTMWLDFFRSLSCALVLLGFLAYKCSLIDLFCLTFSGIFFLVLLKELCRPMNLKKLGRKRLRWSISVGAHQRTNSIRFRLVPSWWICFK